MTDPKQARELWLRTHRSALSLSGMAAEPTGDAGVTLYAKSSAAFLVLAAHHDRAYDHTINDLGFVACASFADLGGPRAIAESLYRMWPVVTGQSTTLANRLAAPALTTAVRVAALHELARSPAAAGLDDACRSALPLLLEQRDGRLQ